MNDRLRTCYHEAGHAVVALAVGLRVNRVTLALPGVAGGADILRRRIDATTPHPNPSKRFLDSDECAVAALAGPLTEQRYANSVGMAINIGSLLQTADTDFESAQYHVGELGIIAASDRAGQIIRERWAAIARLAEHVNTHSEADEITVLRLVNEQE